MPAALWNIILEEGSDFDLEVTYQSTACVAKVVTGYGATFQIKNTPDDSSLITASVSNARISLSGASGIFSINVPAASVTAIKNTIQDGARYNLLIWPTAASTDVDPKRLLEGQVTYKKAYAT